MGRLIIEGNSVYEIDEECERRKLKSREDGSRKQTNRKSGRSTVESMPHKNKEEIRFL